MKIDTAVALREISEFLNSRGLKTELRGENATVTGINSVEHCGPGDITFASSQEYLSQALKNQPAAIVVAGKIAGASIGTPVLITDNVNLAHALIKQKYADWNFRDTEEWGRIHPSAVIHPQAKIADTAIVGPNAVIGRGAELQDGCVVMAGTVVEAEAVIGENTVLHPHVTVGRRCQIGRDCIIRSGTVIGSEGFGFAQDAERKHHRIPQTGIVVIEERCVIGANNCIDRAAYGVTRIRSGVITDNFCHIAHNCDIGEDTIMVAMTGIAGSCRLGKRVICSGQTGMLDHISVPDDTVLLVRAAVTESIEKPGVYAGGPPLLPITAHHRTTALIRNLPQISRDLKALQKKVEELEKKRGDL
jgi:UDP-3-O-[3-hydroxymyristoyl] glucosamine N-acyltransferase